MSHLPECMDTRVGATRAVNHNSFFRNLEHRICEGTLKGGQSRLDLPAVIIRTIISDREFDVAHDARRDYRMVRRVGSGAFEFQHDKQGGRTAVLLLRMDTGEARAG